MDLDLQGHILRMVRSDLAKSLDAVFTLWKVAGIVVGQQQIIPLAKTNLSSQATQLLVNGEQKMISQKINVNFTVYSNLTCTTLNLHWSTVKPQMYYTRLICATLKPHSFKLS